MDLPTFIAEFFRPAKKEEIAEIPPSTEPLIEGTVPVLGSVAPPEALAGVDKVVIPAGPPPVHPDLAALARKHGLESMAKVLEEKISLAQTAMADKDYAKVAEMLEAEKPLIIGNLTMAVFDVNSPTWQWIVIWAKAELDKSRELNDSIIRTDIQTAVLRGEIKMLKRLLELPEKLAGK